MLDLKKNRLDYGEILMPPVKHELTHAVVTTYSLDLYALLAIPLALFYSKVLDGSFEETRLDVLESIQKTADTLSIYCQKGKIKVPRKYNWLFAYIDDSIHQIIPPDHVSSFHPKIWVLRFKGPQGIRYRVIVLSRNLTFDRSWDVALYMDGTLEKRTYLANKPLLDFLNYLFNERSVPGADTLLKELSRVKFEDIDGFDRLVFRPIGFDGFKTYVNPLEGRSFEKLLIMSPFVDRTTLNKLNNNSPGGKTLISREEELQKIPAKALEGYETYFLSKRIVEGETMEELEEAGLEPQRQQLHAKIFIGEHENRYFWFLGSANCTDPAFTRNTEFMIELSGESPLIGPDHMKSLLIDPEGEASVFEVYEPNDNGTVDDESENVNQMIRKVIHGLIKVPFRGKIIPREKTANYDISLIIDMKKKVWEDAISVKVALLSLDANFQSVLPDRKNELLFENLSEVELSRFVIVNIYYKEEHEVSFLIKMEIDLPETRKNKIFKSLISSRESFLKYLVFLLSDNPYLEDSVLGNGQREGGSGDSSREGFPDIPIFEHLLTSASRNPDKLKSVDRLVRRLMDDDTEGSERILPEDFNEFWDIFKQVAGIK